MFKFYKVGGCIRDKFLGVPFKDIDYTVVYNGPETLISAEDVYLKLLAYLKEEKFEVFLTIPSCFTVRAKVPKGKRDEGDVVDFVLARKEIGYRQGTREPICIPGTIDDDLSRRDFTCNAIAEDEFGVIYDPYNGLADIEAKSLRTPISCEVSFNDDPLRILRAIRFSVTKNFYMPIPMAIEIQMFDYYNKMGVVSGERIREELHRCFKHDTLTTFRMLERFSSLVEYIFKKYPMWLKPTTEQ